LNQLPASMNLILNQLPLAINRWRQRNVASDVSLLNQSN